MEQLNLNLIKYGFLGTELLTRLNDQMTHQTFAPDEFILKKGAVNRRVYFIRTGLVKITGDSNGEEIIPWILKENDFVIATDSFFCGRPTGGRIW